MEEIRQQYLSRCVIDNIFRIPEGIDLENKTAVESFVVRGQHMTINLVNGRTIELWAHEVIDEYIIPIDGWIMDDPYCDSEIDESKDEPEETTGKSVEYNTTDELSDNFKTNTDSETYKSTK